MNRREFLTGTSAAALLATSAFAQTGAKPGKIKIGQIGTTHAHAAGKLAAIRKLSDQFELVGVVEPDGERRENALKDKAYQDVTWLTEEQLLNVKGLQAVAVETEVKDLLTTAEKCVAADKHIHLDKPAGEKFSHFQRIVENARRQKLIIQMGYMLRYNPGVQLCYRAAKEGWLGRVFSIEAAMSKALDKNAREGLKRYPGGALFELGCHVLDSAVFVLGKPQKVTAFNRSSSSVNDGFADNQYAVLEYPHATAIIHSAVVEVGGEARRQFTVSGEQGTVEVRPLEAPKVRLSLDRVQGDFKKGWQDVDLPKLAGRYDLEFLDLAASIRGEKAFAWSYDHDLAVQETLLKASGLKVD
ncbi:MAG: yvaA [Verrucomicrobia bacterium]|jgi:predicted dehydrogenase|nr:yvaA [Verrucomicrobiota bacterium]